MLFSFVFIATDPRLFTLSFEGSLEGLASFPSVVAVCPTSPDDFPSSLSHSPPLPKLFRMIYLQKSIKIKDYNSIRIIDLQKTWGGSGGYC